MRFVWPFADSPPGVADQLGVRGRMMRDLARLGMPVPAGFTVSDLACRRFLGSGELPAQAWDEIVAASRRMAEDAADAGRPLLMAVRSSPPVPMPGVLAHSLHVGMTAQRQEELASWASPEFAVASRIGFPPGSGGPPAGTTPSARHRRR